MRIKALISYIIIVLVFSVSCKNRAENITGLKVLPHYPSASGIEYANNRIYIIGDDANNLLILDTGLNAADSVPLYSFSEKRIPKSIKADLEAITIMPDGKLLLTGSGSVAPARNVAWLLDPLTKQKDSIRLDTFYHRITGNDIEELNIEGAAAFPGGFILSNRGSKGYPQNHLIITSHNFLKQQLQAEINVMLAGTNNDSLLFSGVSGLTYSSKTDALIMTVSTEDTRNSLDDGAIGKSYLWIIKNISSKTRSNAVDPDKVIELDELDKRFIGQKIESVCILKETDKQYYLLLAADNDNGSSSLFRLTVSKD